MYLNGDFTLTTAPSTSTVILTVRCIGYLYCAIIITLFRATSDNLIYMTEHIHLVYKKRKWLSGQVHKYTYININRNNLYWTDKVTTYQYELTLSLSEVLFEF